MPRYDYDKDYPFAAFITNLGKYNEGALVGEWVKFPTTAEELKKVFERIWIGAKDDFGQTYEEWFNTDYDCYVDGLYDLLGEYANLDELNYLASKLDDMSQDEYERFQAAMEIGDHTGSIQEFINLTENLDCYDIYPDIHDHDDLGRYYIEELDAMQVPEHLRNYIDYEAYGRDIALEESGQFTDLGYVRDTGDSFHEYYDGERGSIPEEYRVMTFQDDIPEEEISEWAMDLAYDMDEFFRQNDPQYAAEHPEEHAAKEEIYENLMAGRISALDEKLAALGQTQEDYLPSEIEKFKDATGYEEFLDVDPQAIREAIENPDQSHVDEMLAFAEQANREYEAEVYGQQAAPTPDDRETGETVRTPRGTFHVTDMSREQMEAAGYGFHHQSEDGRYLIMANGTRAFAIPAQHDSHIKTAEMSTEQSENMIDGILNNAPSIGELEARAKAGEQVSLSDVAAAVKAERQTQKQAHKNAKTNHSKKKPSIRAQLAVAKKEQKKQPPAREKSKDMEVGGREQV